MSMADHQGERRNHVAKEIVPDTGVELSHTKYDPRHRAYQPSHGRHREWFYIDDLTAERVADVLSDLKPKQRKAAKVTSYNQVALPNDQHLYPHTRFVVWYPAKG